MKPAWLLMLAFAGAAPLTDDHGRPVIPPRESGQTGAIEHRPIWDQPAKGPSLIEQTESALDRGNGRVVDEPTYQIHQLDRDRAIADGVGGTHATFDAFEQDWDRQRQVERAERTAMSAEQRQAKAEVEAQAAEADRQRAIARSLHPSHEEAAILDRQMLEQADRSYQASVDSAGMMRDAAIKVIDGNAQLPAAEKAAQRAIAGANYDSRVRQATIRRDQVREMVRGTK